MRTFKLVSVRRLSLGAAMVMALGVLASFGAPSALAAGDPYRMVLRYYDDVQITYSLEYPATSSRVVKPEDVPIGGVGTPNSANVFAIDGYVFPQVYCVDPWTAFHSQVPGLGESQWFPAAGGDTGYTADSVSGYVDAAPWTGTGAIQAYGAAVDWITTNGYRGEYRHNPTSPEDAESLASVARLNAMFPAIGGITKEIALMATKVAIWKVIGGDSVQVVTTTLDNRADGSRAKFDALVDALVTNALDESNRPSAVTTNEVDASSLSLKIDDTGATYITDQSTTYNYYGPMSVVGTLNHAPNGNLSGMTQSFLSVSGMNSAGVSFVTATAEDPATVQLGTGTLPGTNRTLPMIGGSGLNDTWTSGQFYLAIPKTRTPDKGDQLLVTAQAKAPAVAVEPGTPVVLAFQDSGIQDWSTIQAFVGATTGQQTVDLYAEANWLTGDSYVGDLYVRKTVDNVATHDQDQLFTFAVYYSTDDADTNPAPLNLKDYPVKGAASVNTTSTPNTFTLRNGDIGIIQGLTTQLINSSANYDTYYYWVQEISSTLPAGEYGPPQFVFDNGTTPTPPVNDSTIGPFTINATAGMSLVSVTNERLAGDLTITKVLAGDWGNAGADDTTEFSVIIRETYTVAGKTSTDYLIFDDTSSPFTYKCVGNNGANDPATAGVLTLTAGQPIVVTNLWSNVRYTVIETGGKGYKATYSGNNVLIAANVMHDITVTNTYGTTVNTGGSLVGGTGLAWLALVGGLSLGGWLLFSRRGWAR